MGKTRAKIHFCLGIERPFRPKPPQALHMEFCYPLPSLLISPFPPNLEQKP